MLAPAALVPPWLRLAAIALLAAAAWVHGRTYQATLDHAATDRQRAQDATSREAWLRKHTARAQAISEAHQAESENIRTVTRKVTEYVDKIVERPVYRECLLDADGLLAIAAADRNDLPPAAPEPGR